MALEQVRERTVLIVDDEPQVMEALSDLLEDDFRIVTETSPEAAIRKIGGNPEIAVVLCDQRMPRMTGDQLLAEASQISAATRLLITGYADLQAVVRAVNDGKIFGYISKPWDPDALRIMVHRAAEYHELNVDLEHERALLRDLMEHSPDGIVFKDRERRYQRINAAAARMLRLDRPEDVIGRRPEDLLPSAVAAGIVGADQRVLATGRPMLDIEDRVEFPDGSASWYASSVTPVRDARDQIVSLITITRDITTRRHIESQLRQAQKMEAIGQLTGGIAHDFNNILGVVIGNLDLLSERVLGDQQVAGLAESALDAALRGGDLTKRLLAFARHQDLKPKLTDIGKSLDDVLKLLSRTLGEVVTIEARVAPALEPIELDPAQLESSLVNLALNARDAMPAGGSLVIEVEDVLLHEFHAAIGSQLPPGKYLRIGVTDTGEGIPPEALERVVEPFYTTKPVGKGTGLGLSMVHGFVTQSNGHLTIDSVVGRGTTIRLYLPRVRHQVRAAEPDTAPPEMPLGRGQCILVVEDNLAMRAITLVMLAGLGYRTLEAGTAAEALEVLESDRSIDLVFSDVAMPGSMSGYDLADVVLARRLAPKVLLCSGYTDRTGTRQAGHQAGATVRLLDKPYRREDLAHAVWAVLNDDR